MRKLEKMQFGNVDGDTARKCTNINLDTVLPTGNTLGHAKANELLHMRHFILSAHTVRDYVDAGIFTESGVVHFLGIREEMSAYNPPCED